MVYTIAYDLDGGANHEDNPTKFVEDDLPIELGNPTKAGYTFVAWHTTDEFDDAITEIDDLDNFEIVARTITVYAEFEVIEYTVTYELDGGTNDEGNPATFTVEDLPITLEEPTKALHTFVAWHDAVTLDSPVTEIDEIGNITLYAEFALDD